MFLKDPCYLSQGLNSYVSPTPDSTRVLVRMQKRIQTDGWMEGWMDGIPNKPDKLQGITPCVKKGIKENTTTYNSLDPTYSEKINKN